MTSPLFKKSLLSIAAASMMLPAAAFAADAPSGLKVKSTTDVYVKMSVSAYKKGEFQKSADYSRRALKSSMSKKRQAVAYSNLCAAEAALGNTDAAGEACANALTLRPGFELAEANQSALTIFLAENK